MSTTLAPKPAGQVAYPSEWTPVASLSAPVTANIATKEEHRWVWWLGLAFVGSAVLFAATLATGSYWFMGGALAVGPDLMIFSYIYLSLTSDSNSEAAPAWTSSPRDTSIAD